MRCGVPRRRSTSCTMSSVRRFWLRGLLAGGIVLSMIIGPWWASAADGADTSVPKAAQIGIAPQEQEDYDPEANLPYLFAVYIITWGGFFAYVFSTSRRQREMEREVAALKATLAEKESLSAQKAEGA